MAFTYDLTTSRGQLRFQLDDTDSTNYIFEDAEIDYLISKAGGGGVDLAEYFGLEVIFNKMLQEPSSTNIGGWAEQRNIGACKSRLDAKREMLEAKGIALDGQDIAQFGHIEIARDAHSYEEVETNKALRGEDY